MGGLGVLGAIYMIWKRPGAVLGQRRRGLGAVLGRLWAGLGTVLGQPWGILGAKRKRAPKPCETISASRSPALMAFWGLPPSFALALLLLLRLRLVSLLQPIVPTFGSHFGFDC